MKLELDNRIIDVKSEEELSEILEEYACQIGLGKEQYITDAKLDGKQLIFIGTSMADNFLIDPFLFSLIKQSAERLSIKELSNMDIAMNGYDCGVFPKLKEALIEAIEEIYDVKILYVWKEY